MKRSSQLRLLASWAGIAALLFALPFVFVDASSRFLAITAVLYAGVAMSWNITLGFAGIANFAHMALFGVGAYASAVFVVDTGRSPWLGIPVAAAVAAVCGALVFVPVLRLRGIYVALVTFVFSQLCFYLVLNQSSWTGGSSGIVGLPSYALGDLRLNANGRVGFYFLAAAFLLLLIIVIDLLVRSPFGRGLIALRDNEVYAISRGVPRFRQHFLAFVISGALAGMSGALYAHLVGVVSPELFGFTYTALVLSMVFLGGMGSVHGPVLGAILIVVLTDRLNTHGAWRAIAVSVVIVLIIRFMPNGLAGFVSGVRRWLSRGGRDGHGDTSRDADERNALASSMHGSRDVSLPDSR